MKKKINRSEIHANNLKFLEKYKSENNKKLSDKKQSKTDLEEIVDDYFKSIVDEDIQ